MMFLPMTAVNPISALVQDMEMTRVAKKKEKKENVQIWS